MSSSSPSSSVGFWVLVALTAIGSISCFGYAGIQTVDTTTTDATSSISRQIADTSVVHTSAHLSQRSPISFQRDAR